MVGISFIHSFNRRALQRNLETRNPGNEDLGLFPGFLASRFSFLGVTGAPGFLRIPTRRKRIAPSSCELIDRFDLLRMG
jgi:hypothetical protein